MSGQWPINLQWNLNQRITKILVHCELTETNSENNKNIFFNYESYLYAGYSYSYNNIRIHIFISGCYSAWNPPILNSVGGFCCLCTKPELGLELSSPWYVFSQWRLIRKLCILCGGFMTKNCWSLLYFTKGMISFFMWCKSIMTCQRCQLARIVSFGCSFTLFRCKTYLCLGQWWTPVRLHLAAWFRTWPPHWPLCQHRELGHAGPLFLVADSPAPERSSCNYGTERENM